MPPQTGADIAELYRLYRDDIWRYLLSLTTDRDLAEEILQDAFLAAHGYAHTFDPAKGDPKAWLVTIARNAFYRRGKRTRSDAPIDEPENIADSRASSQSSVDAASLSLRLRSVVDALPEPERSIIRLKYFRDMTMNDCAAKLGLSLSTCARRLADAMKLLHAECRRRGITMDEAD